MDDLNFSWLPGLSLAGAQGPASDADLGALRQAGVSLLVRLVPPAQAFVTPDQVSAAGLEDLWEPIEDFCAPTEPQIQLVTAAVNAMLARGRGVVITCRAGIGRTGTMLSCVLVSRGYTPRQAFDLMRKGGRTPFETLAQQVAIERWAASISRA